MGETAPHRRLSPLVWLGVLALAGLPVASPGPARAGVTAGLGAHATLQSLTGTHREQALRRDAHRRYQAAEGVQPYAAYDAGALSDKQGLLSGDTLFAAHLRGGAASGDWDMGVALPYYALARETGGGVAGLGAVRLHAGYELVPQYEQRPALYGAVLGSVPTEGESALQTGEPAGGGAFSLSRTWPGYRGAVVAGLLQVGDPRVTDYDSVFFYSVRASEQRPFGRLYGALEWRTGYRPGVSETSEVHGGILYRLESGRLVTGEAFLGFRSDTPRIGVRVGVLRWL